MAESSIGLLNIFLSIFSISLLIFTAYLSSQNFKSQKRFGIRESLEQSDDLYLSGSVKLKPVLHDFDHKWGRVSQTRVLIEFYSYNRTELPGVSQLQQPFWYLEEEQIKRVLDSMSNLGVIEDAELVDNGVLVTCRGHEPVKVRNSIRSAMAVIRNSLIENSSKTSRKRYR